ncbi:Lysophosphatidylcholine acyltransferase [Carabus blaptoides fortunei]
MATNAVKTPIIRAVATRSYSSQKTVPICGSVADIKTTVLPNKLVVASADNGSPLARVSVVFRAGSRNECGDSLGATHTLRIAAGLSTKNSSQFAITRNIQQVGASLTCTTDRETIAYTLEGTYDAVDRSSEFLSDIAGQQVFKPWELSDSLPRLKLELASLSPQVRAVNFLHRVAFRQGLGNSLFCAKHRVGKLSSETLQHYVANNFTTNRAAVVGLGVNHDQLVKYAQNMCLESGAGTSASASKYYGGEVRSEKGGDLAFIAVGTEGAALSNQKEALAFAILQRALGVGPYAKRGNESSGLLYKAISGCIKDQPIAVSALNVSYSDTGLFGVILATAADSAGECVQSAVKALRAGSVSDQDVTRAKNQLKAATLLEAESGSNFIEVMGNQAALTGSVLTPEQIIAAIDAGISADDSLSAELLNPFVHHLELETTYEKIKTAICTVILLPIRVIIICYLVITAWLLACIGLWGLTEGDLRDRPLTGWRRLLPPILCFLGKSTYRAGGMNIVIKGKQASRKEAPILVVAPHSTFFDGGIIYITGFPSIIVRRESGMNPYIGKLINFTQPVYVWREDPNSRQNTIKEIIDRATSDQDWPQVLIFPEGTCTNRSCLITFKPGAFYPGVPIQPVCIRYPNKLDTVTWTWEGPGALKLLWLTLTQVTSSCEIEFLPVYQPNAEEKRDPKLFANNVRNVMARALGIPVSDYTYDDCRLMSKAKQMNLPHATDLVEVQKLRQKLGLDQCNIEEHLVDSKMLRKEYSHVTCTQFAHYLNVPLVNLSVQQLFRLYDKDSTGLIDFREYLLGVLGISKSGSTLETLKLACKIYDHSGTGYLSLDDFTKALSHTLQMTVEEAEELFDQIVGGHARHVTFDQFLNFAVKKAEFANLFGLSKEEKQNRQNGASEKEIYLPCWNLNVKREDYDKLYPLHR